MLKNYDVGIIGGGIVGLAGAIYSGRLGLKCIVFADELFGTLAKTDIVENYPGFKKISGKELTKKFLEHAKEYDNKFVEKRVDKIIKNNNGFKLCVKNKCYNVKSLILATGSNWKKLNVSGEKAFLNKGVHYCALCDGLLYKHKIVAVIGSGDSAAKEALLLKNYAKQVYIIARKKFHPESSNLEKIKKNKKIKIYEGIEIKEIIGKQFVNSILLTKKINDKYVLNLNGIFIDVGMVSNSKLAKLIGVKLNNKKEIKIDKESRTNIKYVYSAGDCANTKFKQAITGVGEVVKAVYSAYEDLK